MRVFLLDLWLDLREKRLAPVALALLAGLLIVPFVLAKGEPDPPAPPPVAQQEGDDLPEVSIPADGATIDSRLTAFDPRDPFEPRSAAQGGTTTTDTGAAPTGGTGTTGGGTTTTDTGTTDTGTTGGGTTTDTGSGTGTGTGTTGGGTTTERRTVIYTFTVDLLFGEFGEERRHRGVRRLELVPNEDDPAVVFLGVTTSGRTAVFLVDDRFTVTGEGICRPEPDECTFLYLRESGDRNSAILTEADGTRYRLSLRDIDRVVAESQAQTDSDAEDDNTGSGDNSPAFTGSTRDNAPPGEPESEEPKERSSFRSPVFADDADDTGETR